jgi:hypothetical protein
MNLVQIAEDDLAFTLEDVSNGFGVQLTFYDGSVNNQNQPIGKTVNCQTTDIGYFVDPQSGAGVAGRQVEITCRISSLNALSLGYPLKTWTISYIDTNSKTWTFGIQQVRPDRKLGIYNIILEGFK